MTSDSQVSSLVPDHVLPQNQQQQQYNDQGAGELDSALSQAMPPGRLLQQGGFYRSNSLTAPKNRLPFLNRHHYRGLRLLRRFSSRFGFRFVVAERRYDQRSQQFAQQTSLSCGVIRRPIHFVRAQSGPRGDQIPYRSQIGYRDFLPAFSIPLNQPGCAELYQLTSAVDHAVHQRCFKMVNQK